MTKLEELKKAWDAKEDAYRYLMDVAWSANCAAGVAQAAYEAELREKK